MAETTLNVLAVLKEIYEPGVQGDYNASTPILSMLTRTGRNLPTMARNHFFAIKTKPGQTDRVYGSEDPFEFATCDGSPARERVCIRYKKAYTPYTLSHEITREATEEGAMFNVLRDSLEDIPEQAARTDERQFLTSDGRGVLFALDGTEAGPDADGNWTYGIKWYGGQDGEEIGQILESLNICGLEINVAEACGSAPRATALPGNIAKIEGIDANVFGAETIKVNTRIVAAADGDVVYPSRQDNNGVQGCTDGFTGLPALVDDFTVMEPFQCLTEDDCGTFKARILDNGGVLRDLDEVLLSQAVTLARIRASLKRGETMSFASHAFICNTATVRKFANMAATDRRLTAPSLWGKGGVKPYFGVDVEATTFDGIPFLDSQLAFLNRVDLVDMPKLGIAHNGPPEGQFLASPDGRTVRDISCSPRSQYVWWRYKDFFVRSRKGMVSIRDLTSFGI